MRSIGRLENACASTHFEQLKQRSSFLALAEISLSGVAALAVQDNVDVCDRHFKVVRVAGLHLNHVARHFNHTTTTIIITNRHFRNEQLTMNRHKNARGDAEPSLTLIQVRFQ